MLLKIQQIKIPSSRRAFTLIEMLLVASLLSVTGLAVYHAIANGIKIWEYSRRYSSEEDVSIFFEKIASDLQNTYSYSSIVFDGKPEKILIPTIVHMTADKHSGDSGQTIEQIGSVEYFYQKGKKTIFRRQNNYSQALKKKKNTDSQALAAPVEELHFTYYVIEGKTLKPKKSISDGIPVSIQVDVDFTEAGGAVRQLRRMITIPIGNKL